MATHDKLDRKTIAQPDEFHVAGATALSWLQTHRAWIVGSVIGVVVFGVAAAVLSSQRREALNAAAVGFRDAHKQFAAKAYAEAGVTFQKVTTENAGTPFANLAILYRGHTLAQQGDAAAAATAYQDFIATGPADYLRQQALLGLATAKLAAGDTAAAADAYDKGRALPGPFETEIALAAARLKEQQGQTDAARSVYLELLKKPALDPATRTAVLAKLPSELRPPEAAVPGL